MPFLSMRRRPALEMRRRTQRFSFSTQNRRYCRFGRNRRLVLLLAWETLFPTIGPLPVTSQTRAIAALLRNPPGAHRNRSLPRGLGSPRPDGGGVRPDASPAKPAIIACGRDGGWGGLGGCPLAGRGSGLWCPPHHKNRRPRKGRKPSSSLPLWGGAG